MLITGVNVRKSTIKKVPMVINKSGSIMRDLCERAGLGDRKYTNHSLRSYVITKLDEAGHNSESILRRSGHSSSAGLKQYVRATIGLEVAQQKSLTKVQNNIKQESVPGGGVTGNAESTWTD